MAYPTAAAPGTVHTEIAGRPRVMDHDGTWQDHPTRYTTTGGPVLVIGDSLSAFNLGFFSRSVLGEFGRRGIDVTVDALSGRSMTDATAVITPMATVPPWVVLQLITNDDAGNVLPAETTAFTSATNTNIGLLRARGATRIMLTTGHSTLTGVGAIGPAIDAKNGVVQSIAAAEPDVGVIDIGAVIRANLQWFAGFFDGVHHEWTGSHRFGVAMASR